ncbi:Phosphogluconate dehydratase, partial [hydrothermal vent metagenome]
RPLANPFAPDGGMRLLQGNLGRSVIKVSAVASEHQVVEAPAVIFHDQDDFLTAFQAGNLHKDMIAVIRFQGPKANGMPELHKLSPALASLQDKGFKVALLTDGRMSGASGKIPAAIHITPEAKDAGPLARLRDGDIIRLDAKAGRLDVLLDASQLAQRQPITHAIHHTGMGRELFENMRNAVGAAELGASVFWE